MMAAEMYGMMLSAKIAIRPNAPPANILNMPMIPPACCSKICSMTTGSIPGAGM